MYLFAAQAALPAMGSTARQVRSQTLANYRANIAETEQALIDDYGVDESTAAIAWPEYEKCLWNADGLPGGAFGHRYFRRVDASLQGMTPAYPLGGTLGSHLIWKSDTRQGPIPLTVDYLVNPDLFAVLVLAFLAVVLGALVWRARRDERRAASTEASRRAAAKKAAAPPEDPGLAECREYVATLEADGYDMSNYRKLCGLPPAAG